MSFKISVIIPCFNQGSFLNQALKSILDQIYQNWECIIIDDGSTDLTEKVAREFEERDKRIKYFYQENKGLSSARNLGLEKSSGDYIQFLDSDDYILKDKLEKSIREIQEQKTPGSTVVITNFRMFSTSIEDTFDPYCKLNSDLFSFQEVLTQWPVRSIPIHCGLFERRFFEFFSFPENLTSVEDWVLWLNLFKKGYKALFINEPLVLYRRHANSLTTNFSSMDDNLKKAIRHIKPLVPIEDYIYISFKTAQANHVEKFHLLKKIEDLEKSSIALVSKKIKNSYLGLVCKKLIKGVGL